MTRALSTAGTAPLWVFGIAFGAIEAAVVVYLRALLEIEGDALFPMRRELTLPQARAMGVELLREAATLVLMLAPAWLFHPRPFVRFVAYMLVFGVWDLAYYGFLKLLLGWPAGLTTLKRSQQRRRAAARTLDEHDEREVCEALAFGRLLPHEACVLEQPPVQQALRVRQADGQPGRPA